MPIKFKRSLQLSQFLDPTKNFEPTSLPIEFRIDPLTRHTSVICGARYRKPEKPDLSALLEKSPRATCPFCPGNVERVTTKFPSELFPEGRLRLNDAYVFPNLMPYMPYSAIVVISSEHFTELCNFDQNTLTNAFLASQVYLKRISQYDADAKYYTIDWNYLPPSASSIVHPHLQVFAGSLPTSYQGELLEASQRYCEQNGTNFWSEFVAREKRLGERYIRTIGNISWFTAFVSRGWLMDVMAIFEEANSVLNLSETDFANFSQGLMSVLRYMNDQNFYSFNLAIYSGIVGQNYFWTQARIVPRFLFPPLDASDAGSLRILHDEFFNMQSPEVTCEHLREYF